MPDTNDCNRTGICPAEARAGRIPARGRRVGPSTGPGRLVGPSTGPAETSSAEVRRVETSQVDPRKRVQFATDPAPASSNDTTRGRMRALGSDRRRVVAVGGRSGPGDGRWLRGPSWSRASRGRRTPPCRPPPAVGPGRLDAKGAREAWLVSRIGASPCGGVGRWSTDLSTSWLNRQPSEQIPYGPPDDHSVKRCSCHRKHGGAQISATFHVKHGNGRRRPRPSWVLWPTHENALFSPCGSHG